MQRVGKPRKSRQTPAQIVCALARRGLSPAAAAALVRRLLRRARRKPEAAR